MEYISHDNSWFRVGVPLPPQGESVWYAGFVNLVEKGVKHPAPPAACPGV